MTATESAYAEQIAEKLIDTMPTRVSKIRPSHTFTYEMDSDDLLVFAEHPKIIHKIYKRAVSMACERYWTRYKVRHIEDEQEKQQEIFRHNSQDFNKGLEAFDRVKVNLVFYSTTSMRQIGPKVEGQPIVFDGRIMAVGTKNGYIKEAWAYCPNRCDADIQVNANPTLRTYIPKCHSCNTPMKIRTDSAITDFVQVVKIQELDNTLQQQPITLDMKVIGDDVFNTWIGKRVRIAGHFLTDIESAGKKHEHKQYVFVKYMHEIEEVDNVCISKERSLEIKEMLKDPENQTRLFKSFAPEIEGRLDIKESLCYAFAGGSQTEVRRTDINILEIGNAGHGKSETIKQIPRVIAKSMYFLGNNATSAGIGIGMVKLDNNTSVPQGGPLVVCNPHGCVAIDELDKMHAEDRRSLLSSMEQQVVTKVVAGATLSLPSQVSIIAAANPKYGEWDESHGIVENINFEAYLLTRFDIVWCSVKNNSIKKQAIAAKILGLAPITKDQQLTPLLSEAELLQYINYCKKGIPKLSMDSKKMLNEFYQQMSELTEGEENVIPMTPRELEGLIRLSTARAKLLQKDVVDVEDVDAVIQLKKKAMESFPGVTLKGDGRQLQLLSEMDSKQKSKMDVLLECADEENKVSSSEVCDKWVEEGVYKTLQKAEREFQALVGEKLFLRGDRYVYRH
jgi:replicative DNA helicase Mcm